MLLNVFMGTKLDKLLIGNCYLEKNNQNKYLIKDYKNKFEIRLKLKRYILPILFTFLLIIFIEILTGKYFFEVV